MKAKNIPELIDPKEIGLEHLFWSCPNTPAPADTIIKAAIKSAVFENILVCVKLWGIDRVLKNYNEIKNYIKQENIPFLDFQFKIFKEVLNGAHQIA